MSASRSKDSDTSSDRCSRCKEWKLYPERCQCRLFEVAIPWKDQVEEWSDVYAIDAETAAEKYAEKSDCDSVEYSIVSSGSGEVWTRNAHGTIQKWDISAEAVPTYYAREKR